MIGSRQTLKAAYFRCLSAARADALIRMVRNRRGQVVVLNLHRVAPDPNPYWPALDPSAFAALVSYLGRHCDLLSFGRLREAGRSSRLRVVLSFDDGCRDFIEYVVPILDERGIAANQNVVVKSVETGRPPWIIAVMDALAAAPPRRVKALEVPGFPHRLEGDDDEAKVRYGTLLANYLKAIPASERSQVCPAVDALLDETAPDRLTPMMAVDEVKSIMGLHELGCHSYSHESMGSMADHEFDAEIDRCQEFFSGLGTRMDIFAFPNGSHRPEQVERLRARGVEHVLLVDERASTAVSGVHPRFTIYGASARELRVRAMGWTAPRWARALSG